jgi:hypothetical protein
VVVTMPPARCCEERLGATNRGVPTLEGGLGPRKFPTRTILHPQPLHSHRQTMAARMQVSLHTGEL